MSSKSIKPKQRLGMTSGYRRKRIITWVILAALGGAGLYGYRRYNEGTEKVEVPVSRVRRADFVISVRTRGGTGPVNVTV